MADPQFALNGSLADFLPAKGKDLLDRLQPLTDWFESRYEHGVDPYSKSSNGPILAECRARDRLGRNIEGVNMASQDYLSLSSHPEIKKAAVEAAERYGVHSAGSPALMGNTSASLALEDRIATFCNMKDCTVFPTGWAAGYGLIRAIVRPIDHIVIDQLAHASLMEGAKSATQNVHVFPHLSAKGLERRLQRVATEYPGVGILVITESLFSMDSDTPDLAAHQELATRYGARLMVDAAHDLGCMGPGGRGLLGQQGMWGKVDILMGSFSKTFASNGGFVASNHPALKLALRYGACPLTFSNAISPVQASVVLKALDIVGSAEGNSLRQNMLANSEYLRDGLRQLGLEVLGDPSPIVSVVLGDSARSRLITRFTLAANGIVNLVEFPAVAKNACRFRLQVMATHTRDHIDSFIGILKKAILQADELLEELSPQITIPSDQDPSAAALPVLP